MGKPIAVYQGSIENDTFYFAPIINGQRVYRMILDTGAFELTFGRQAALALGLPNLGTVEIGGIGGVVIAFQSVCAITIRARVYENVPCIVDPTFADGSGLFGLRFFVDNRISLKLNPVTQKLILSDAVGCADLAGE